jgi:hypothetical protein
MDRRARAALWPDGELALVNEGGGDLMGRAVLLAAPIAAAALLCVGVGAAVAYGGDGKMDVYQIGISFNCNNPDFCGSDGLGGFWGWAELDSNPATGAHTGDAQFTGCGHGGQFNGAGHTSIDITDWWVANGSAGPNTLFTDEVDTSVVHGQIQVQTITNNDTGIPLMPGHQSATDIFGFTPPPGVAVQLQIAYKPAH